MAIRQYSQPEHDQIVRASAGTYSQLLQQGYKVSINPGLEKNQQVGSGNHPDVILWKPNPPPNDNAGAAVIIEEIETEESVTAEEAVQWKKFGELGVSKFLLIVPTAKVKDALTLVQAKGVKVTEIWSYEKRGDKYFFTKNFTLP